jgi:uncharacterized protein
VTERRKVVAEVVALYLLTLIAIRGVVELVRGLGLNELLLAAVPILFMYAPVWSCRLRGADPDRYPISILWPWTDPKPWLEALRLNAILWAALFVPFVLGYHLWQTYGLPALQEILPWRLYARAPELQWIWPASPIKLLLYHVFFVAIPEEMFYRGYLQSRLDEVLPPRWSVLGTMVGPGLLATCVLFAFGHSLVILQWWHVFIIVPSLVFGWLRIRTGDVIAGALFHASCNVTVAVLDTLYGIVPP